MTEIEKAGVKEMMATGIAKGLTADAVVQNTPGVVGAIGNNRGHNLKLYATVSWTGSFHTAPPGSINVGGRAQYTHTGSRGALIYGQEQGSSNAAGYLLAWSMGSFGRRVYVKCGPIAEVFHNGWEAAAISNLSSSGASSSARDDRTSSRFEATITDESGTFPLGVIRSTLA